MPRATTKASKDGSDDHPTAAGPSSSSQHRFETLEKELEDLKAQKEKNTAEAKKIEQNKKLIEDAVKIEKKLYERIKMENDKQALRLHESEENERKLKSKIRDKDELIRVTKEQIEDVSQDIKTEICLNKSHSGFNDAQKLLQNLIICTVCNTNFDKSDKAPATLQCGHIACKACCNVKENKILICQSCGKSMEIEDEQSVEALPIGQAIINLLD
uniref:RING-type domain-containing protein n=1 Tax=Caenorhabditis tropicalis TaxID=1561998 RepID=A0A1I7TLK8_9PELO